MTDELRQAFERWAEHATRHPEGTPPDHPVRQAIRAAAERALRETDPYAHGDRSFLLRA